MQSCKPRTDHQKRLLDERPVARREKLDRYLEEEPEYQRTENESIMRYNENNGNLNVESTFSIVAKVQCSTIDKIQMALFPS